MSPASSSESSITNTWSRLCIMYFFGGPITAAEHLRRDGERAKGARLKSAHFFNLGGLAREALAELAGFFFRGGASGVAGFLVA